MLQCLCQPEVLVTYFFVYINEIAFNYTQTHLLWEMDLLMLHLERLYLRVKMEVMKKFIICKVSPELGDVLFIAPISESSVASSGYYYNED